MQKLLFALCWISLATDSIAEDRFGGEPGEVRVYKTSAGAKRKLELYLPPGHDPEKSTVPGLIPFHSGGCSTNGKNHPKGHNKKGGCVTDAKSAIRWFKQNAGEFGIDPDRTITGGGSAGGHISALATMNPDLNDPADPKDIDTKVVAYLWFNAAFAPEDQTSPSSKPTGSS
jgi:carboxylesterase type B